MFDIGWTELVLIGVVALIVIGPKDLPVMFHTLGRFSAKLRAMAREFQGAMEQAAKDSGVGDVAKDLKNITSPKAMGIDAVRDAADRFEKWDPLKAAMPTSVASAAAANEAAMSAEDAAASAKAARLEALAASAAEMEADLAEYSEVAEMAPQPAKPKATPKPRKKAEQA